MLFQYWRRGWQASAFGAFTLVCTLAFGINLPLQLGWFGDARWPSAVLTCVTGLLPPSLWHVVWSPWRHQLPRPRLWRLSVIGFYGVSIAIALWRAADDLEWTRWPWLDSTSAIMLAIAAMLGLAASLGRNSPQGHLIWLRLLLTLMLLPLAVPGVWVDLLPDYLVLAFFCITLYYREKVLFFDVVLRRGAYFLIGLLLLNALGASLLWLAAWMAAPLIFHLSCRFVDRYLLGRRLSAADAERLFWLDTQSATTEAHLREAAMKSLSVSFHTTATILLKNSLVPADSLAAAMDGELIVLAPRSGGYWSEDERLLQSLARAYAILRENVRLREREQDLRLLASRAELRALRAQINPHFLFNSLNAIAGLIHTDPALADSTVERLAEVFRYTLRRADQEWVRVEDELDFVQAYLAVQHARFGERLQVEWFVGDGASRVTIPAMTIQPLVENAIVHGASNCCQISLRVTLEGQRLRAVVRDNGGGFPPGFVIHDSDATHGLRNIHLRLQGYYGADAGLRWESNSHGSMVMWELPLKLPLELALERPS